MAIAFVNNATGTTDNASHSSETLTLSITSGNLIVVSGTFGDNGSRDTKITCTDNLGTPTVYNLWLYTYDTVNGQALWTFWGIATATGSATITITVTSATTFWRFGASQFSGSFPTNPIDELSSNIMTWTTATDNITSGAKVTEISGDLVYGAMFNDVTLGATFTAGTGFNARSNAGDFVTEDKIQSSAGSVAATFTSTTTNSGLIHMIAFSETAGDSGGGNPRTYVDFENSSNGTTLTAAILNAGTHSNDSGASWGTATMGATMKVATAAEKPLLQAQSIFDGTSFTDSASTRGITFDASASTSAYATYQINFRSAVSVVQFWYMSNIPANDTGFYAMTYMAPGTDSSEFLSILLRPQGGTGPNLEMAIHTNSGAGPDSGSALLYTPNKWYWIELLYCSAQAGSQHQLAIYDDTGTLLQLQKRTIFSGTDHALPSAFRLGRVGDSGTPAGGLIYIDDLIIDGVNGLFPVPPITIAAGQVFDHGDYAPPIVGGWDSVVTVW